MFTAEERRKYLGGSDISAVMGLNRWKTPLKLWLEKTGESEPEDLSKVEAVQLGTELEEFVAQKFSRETGKQVRKQPKMYVHKDYPYMVAHVDRLITGTDELLECKTCSYFKKDEWENDGIPQEYILQVMWYLGITGRKKGYIAVLIGGQSFKYTELEFDSELFDTMVEKAKDFWDKVQNNIPPEISANDGEVIREMFPKSSGDIVEDLEAESEVALLQEVKEHLKELSGERDELETKVKNRIRGNLGISTMKYIITWKEQETTNIDRVAMAKDGVLDKYIKKSTTRRLSVKNNPAYQATQKGEQYEQRNRNQKCSSNKKN